MKIEMNKKYKTRDGHDVKIYEVYENEKASYVHGAYLENGLWFSFCWNIEGVAAFYIDKSLDLVEVKEDWEILVEHFEKNKNQRILAVIQDWFVHFLYNAIEVDNEFLKISTENGVSQILKKNVKLATLEDCKQFILEK